MKVNLNQNMQISMKNIINFIDHVEKILSVLAGGLLVFIMMLTCIDVIGNAFGHPILGVEELTSVCAAITIAFVLPLAHKNRAHIGIDILYRRMGKDFKRFDDIFVTILNTVLFFLLSWQSYKYAMELKEVGEVTSTLEIPKYLILYGVFLGCSVVFLVCLKEVFFLLQRKK